jgi:hypothetical protein
MNLLAACILVVMPGNGPQLPAPTPRPVDFARDVEPILKERCLSCHGPKKQKSGFRLDSREAALRGGDSGAATIVVGKSAESPLIRFVAGLDADMVMPPADGGKPALTAEQVSVLRAWIDQGAVWSASTTKKNDPRDWWSLAPLTRRSPPGPGHPIDAFIHARLREKALTTVGPADRRTLIRRLYFDLIGLPPTPEDVAAFDADSDPQAYEKLVDKLLASPRYGEHWGRHWLDVVGYADTHGNDHDYARPNAWPYRDYVVRSLNEDIPYPRFVQEQIAADALFPDNPQATVALGFLAAGPWDDTLMATVREDTVDHRLSQYLDRDNMVSTVMGTFQSLTVHCARCHNHKFDPISQREYYGLQAVFAGVDRADRPFDADPRTHSRRQQLLARKQAIARRTTQVLASLESPETQKKVADAAAALESRATDWTPLDVVNVVSVTATEGTLFARQADGSWLVLGTRPDKDTFVVTARTKLQGIRALRLEVLPDDSLPHHGPGRYDNGNFHLSEFRATAQPESGPTQGAVKLQFARALADHSDAGDVVANTLDGRDDTYWSIHPRYGDAHEAVFELKEPAGFAVGTTLTLFLDFKGKPGHQIGRFRLSACTDSLSADRRAPVPAAMAPLLRNFAAATPVERRELALQILAREVDRELAALPAPHFVYAATHDFPVNGSFKPSPEPRPVHLLLRGDINKPGELVGPGALGCLPGLAGGIVAADADESERRAALARWLTDSRNVLTWRSIVNRVWHYHFGRGLCDTPNDFGHMGGNPSHPELLDWLAIWFRDDAKGSLKDLHRLLVTSAAYRRSSADGPTARVDTDNRLLWRMNRPRLTGEQVRDAVLQMSCRLDLAMGGPVAVQFVHRGKATFMPDGGVPAFLDYDGFNPDAPENRRRSIYRFVFRTVADPFLDALDCPDGSAVTPVRSASTTALQALAMLNDAFLIRQCEHMARLLASKAATPESQIESAFRLILLRTANAKERDRFAAYARRHGLANVCHVLLNTNEFLYVD